MENPRWTAFVYLAVSAVVSYFLIKAELGQEGDVLLSLAHNVRKVARRVDTGLTSFIDGELDNRRTV